MLIEQSIPLYARESVALFHGQRLGKENPISLFELALRKIGRLLARTKMEEIYPLCALFNINQEVDTIQKQVVTAIADYQQRLASQILSLSEFDFQAQFSLKITFGNPLIFNLAQLTKKFDELMRLLTLAKHTGVLAPQPFFQEKEKHWSAMSGLILQIINLDLQHMPSVRIEEYLIDSHVYEAAIPAMGEVEMAVLHAALKMQFLPYMDAQKLENYQLALKEKAKQKRSATQVKKTDNPSQMEEAIPVESLTVLAESEAPIMPVVTA